MYRIFFLYRVSFILWVTLFCWNPRQVDGDSDSLDSNRPNFIVFLCDDLGYGDLECFGHPHIKTPHLNQLASDGIRFTDCYSAAPVCSPSRVGLLTGRSPNRAGVYDWIPQANPNTRKPDAREQVHLRSSEVTLPGLLQAAGYATCMAGKWHCNSRFNDAAQPQPGDFGFDHWLATQNNAGPSHENPTNFVRNGEWIGKVESFSCNYVAREASQWLTGHHRDHPDQPFFIFIPFHEPHEPVASPPALVRRYTDLAENEDQAQYFANVQNVDVAVGSVLQTLEELKLAENTIVFFTSDNGPETLNRYPRANRSYGVPTPLRGMKLHTHEAGFRVAGILRWPARVQSGQEISQPVSSLDLLPTFCGLADAEMPDHELDGIDILPILMGEGLERAKPLFWCYFNAINEARAAMRDGHWKVLAKLDGGAIPNMQNLTPQAMERVRHVKLTDLEIYNMENDISETTNLALTSPELAKTMEQKIQQSFDELNRGSHVWKPQGPGNNSSR